MSDTPLIEAADTLQSVRDPSQQSPNPTIVYLDQNKWIDLARAAVSPAEHPELRKVLECLCDKASRAEVRLPLTWANTLETHKINRLEQRFHLAYTQVTLSEAWVFRGRTRRLDVEIARVLARTYGLEWVDPEPGWFLSNTFFEAAAEASDERLGLAKYPKAQAWITANPKEALFSYLMETPEEVRKEAIRRFTVGCEALRADIEGRRAKHKTESVSMRRRIYSVITAMETQDQIIAIATRMGLDWKSLADKGGAALRAVIRETPALHIEREISLRLEAQERLIELNDMRDMQAFCTVLPYADIVVAEQQFTSLARQAGLPAHYGVRLETDIRALPDLL